MSESPDDQIPENVTRFQSILDSKMPVISEAISAYSVSQAKIIERFAIKDCDNLADNISQHNFPEFDNDVRDFFINLEKVFLMIENIINCIKSFPKEKFDSASLNILQNQFYYLKRYREAFVGSYGHIYDYNDSNL